MAYTSSQVDSKAERNQINQALHSSPQWRSAITAFGLNPDGPLKLTKAQQQSLAQQLGLPTKDFHIDGAGNINDYHGWKGLPTAAKIAIGAAAAVGTAGAAGAFGGGAAAAGSATGAGAATGAGTAAAAGGTGVATAAGGSLAGTLLKYGLQYGVPITGGLIGNKMTANAQRDSDAAMMDYYNKALDAEKEERDYRRGFDEDERRYGREFGEEGRRYGRYSDTYGRESDEEDRGYDRAGDTYGRASDEERLAYDRSQAIRDKNYGYQQYGNFVETLEPYRAGGSAAASRMSQLMGGPATADTGSYLNLANTARNSVQAVPNVPGRPTWDYQGTRPTWNYPSTGNAGSQPSPSGGGATPGGAPVSTGMPVGGSPTLVRVQAPDGEIREMSEAMAASAVRLGARIV